MGLVTNLLYVLRFRDKGGIGPLEERLETLERQLKAIRLEWEDTFEQLQRVLGRLNKRAQRAEAAQEPRPEDGEGNGHPPTEDPFLRSLDPISRGIIERRRRGGILPR